MKPNHICKNANCPHGINGEPKHYYACNYCDAANVWRSMACCPECYEEYIKQVVEARAKKKKVDLLPKRTDMTEQEVRDLIESPLEEVLENTKQELSEYLTDGRDIAEAVEDINREIDNANTPKRRKRKK